jgi:hypothetical protein
MNRVKDTTSYSFLSVALEANDDVVCGLKNGLARVYMDFRGTYCSMGCASSFGAMSLGPSM